MESLLWPFNLKFLRKKFNKTQGQLALELGTTQQTIGNWEKGDNKPDLYDLIKLTNIFGVSVDEFLKENLENQLGFTNKTGKKGSISIKETKVLLIEDASMLHDMQYELRQMRAEYDRRLSILESKLLGWQDIGNRVNEPEVAKSKVV